MTRPAAIASNGSNNGRSWIISPLPSDMNFDRPALLNIPASTAA
jgi:hypothetical protein